jgi:hypothetical protein
MMAVDRDRGYTASECLDSDRVAPLPITGSAAALTHSPYYPKHIAFGDVHR